MRYLVSFCLIVLFAALVAAHMHENARELNWSDLTGLDKAYVKKESQVISAAFRSLYQ